MVPEEETATTTEKTGQSRSGLADLEAVEASLESLGGIIDTQELRLLLPAYSHVDCVLEAHRFASTWTSGPLRTLLPFERWLRKASPRMTPDARAAQDKSLAGDEIERRVRRFRQHIAGGEVFGEKFLGLREVNWLCAEYEDKLRKR